VTDVAATPHRRRRRRGRQVAVAAAAVAALGAAVTAAVGFGAGGQTPAAATLPPNTAQVTKQTLLDTQSEDGSLGYGDATTLANRLMGTLTSLPLNGAVFTRGKTLYKVDNKPVVLMYGSVPAFRDLGRGAEGADVKQLETSLKALGYTGFAVDKKFDADTAAAVKEWQDDLGLDQTGRVELGRVVFAPGAVRVGEVKAGLGQPAQPGSETFTYTGTTRLVTVELSVADQRLARKGAKVKVTLPGGTGVNGQVQSVSTVIEASSQPDGSPETKIKAIVSLSDLKAADGLDAASVDVVFTAAEHKDVLTVPVAALVALAEGGYGVEVVDGSTSHYVRVETGLFASGRVEVSGSGIADGTTVGMPR
jgi:peptidoglycan hydrolase-like protein with peptidoglycan-binding domain